MRDWSEFDIEFSGSRPKSFDLTYEGLKFSPVTIDESHFFYVLILPMRDWNSSKGLTASNMSSVLILPMRDWNKYVSLIRIVSPNRFDLTYEGLKFEIAFWCLQFKLSFDLTYEGLKSFQTTNLDSFCFVLILPMRDWNMIDGSAPGFPNSSFWSYLWGIEISRACVRCTRKRHGFDLTYEGLK